MLWLNSLKINFLAFLKTTRCSRRQRNPSRREVKAKNKTAYRKLNRFRRQRNSGGRIWWFQKICYLIMN